MLRGVEEEGEAGLDSGEAVGDGGEGWDGVVGGFRNGFALSLGMCIGGGGVVGGDDCYGVVVDGLPDRLEVVGRVSEGWRADVFGAFPPVGYVRGFLRGECVQVQVGACSDF